MVYTQEALQEGLSQLRQQFKKSFESIELEFEDHISWLQTISDGLRKGTINVRSLLVPKTPGKRAAPLDIIRESLDSTIDIEDADLRTSTCSTRSSTRSSTRNSSNKRGAKNGPNKKQANAKQKRPSTVEEEEESPLVNATKSVKRLSDDADSSSKRIRLSTASRDSGLSSVGSRNTGCSAYSGVNPKPDVMSPKEVPHATASVEEAGSECEIMEEKELQSFKKKSISSRSINVSDPTLEAPETSTPEPSQRRTHSVGRETSVVQDTNRKSTRSSSVPRPQTPEPQVKLLQNVKSPVSNISASSSNLLINNKVKGVVKSPSVSKAPFIQMPKGESVKKAVKAFEALREDHESTEVETLMAPPVIPPPAKAQTYANQTTSASSSSLDDAVNAPTRLTRTKTRAMAKAAAEEVKQEKPQELNTVSKILKSPIQGRLMLSAIKHGEQKTDSFEKENVAVSSSKFMFKPFGSASKQNSLFKSSTPFNRSNLLTPSHCISTSFTAPRLNNLVTSMESFISKPIVNQEPRPTREDNLQKIVAKAEVASKKKEEMIKAQMEERVKKRQEKRLKVCATREAMEKEKHEMQQRLEREREEKQKQLQAEREEKLRQEALKKKRLAMQKAAETEERRRLEEAARLAKLKLQEEEQRKLAAQRKKEQEEAERRHQERIQQERIQQEREAAALRAKEAERAAKEAERLAKEAALKAKKVSKVHLDQTYDMLPPDPQSYGLTPVPEDRVPLPPQNPDNYGIDDVCTDDSSEDESKPKKQVPLWAQSKQRMPKLMDDSEITLRQMLIFFDSKKSTPDLSKIFTEIDKRQLIRKSSAVWRTPPVKGYVDF